VKRLTRLGGMLVGAGAAVVAVFWLLKDRITGPPQIPIDEPPPFRVSPTPVSESAGVPDDLSEVNGIGPVYRARLAEAGIDSFAALAAADPALVAEAADTSESRAADWIEQAAALAAG
jgi:predicted flap endonuclease-1-like 5' DNA nuclease